ncbi:MAG: A/G-specific adenine glycosylase [Omnitrophica WOR_2 bacterium GWA2_47_8]|nr:MAG: A/G-specific adenine glycosylase [Omnitrophica WOR_2 bacterium GWA2_47_8]
MSEFSSKLNRWYLKNARDLPWRQTKDPYKIWISEIMLQQTTVAAVIPFYERWVKVFPVVQHVAKAPLQKILKAWQGLGYYSRARNIQKAAKLIVKNFKGKIPSDQEALKTLPGFGPYTIGAVSSIAFDKRVPIIDANVRRVVMRYLALEGFADTSYDTEILKFLDKVMPQKGNNVFNQAMMELGALVCLSRSPACMFCPVNVGCEAYKQGRQEVIPQSKKKEIKEINVAIALIEKDKKYFIQRRPKGGLFADLWEFPGGKIEKGETPKQALFREIKEELGIELGSAEPLMNVTQFYTEFKANLHVFRCESAQVLSENSTRKWVPRQKFSDYPMPSGSVKIVKKLFL